MYVFFISDEEGESDFQSEMEWDSDGKDEVDGVLPPPKRSKIESASPRKWKRTSGSRSELDEDEQKKIHEGANALLNLAGLIMNNRSSNGPTGNTASRIPKAGRPSKTAIKSEGGSGAVVTKKKKKVKKKLFVKSSPDSTAKKAKKVVTPKTFNSKKAKAPVVDEVKVIHSSSRRGTAKRKNAGSNGKYDNGDFTTSYKVSRSNEGSRRSTPVKNKEKSVATTSNNKLPSSTDSNKSKKTTVNGKTLGKKAARKKLPLSKSFGTSSKLKNTSGGPSDKMEVKTSKKNTSSVIDNDIVKNNGNNITNIKVDKKVPKLPVSSKKKKKDITSNPKSNNVTTASNKDNDTNSEQKKVSGSNKSPTTNINNNEVNFKPAERIKIEDENNMEREESKDALLSSIVNGAFTSDKVKLEDLSNGVRVLKTEVKTERSDSLVEEDEEEGDVPPPICGTPTKGVKKDTLSGYVSVNGYSERNTEELSPTSLAETLVSLAASCTSHHFTRFSKNKATSSS